MYVHKPIFMIKCSKGGVLMFRKKIVIVFLLIVAIVFQGFSFSAPSQWAKDSYYSLKYEGIIDDNLTEGTSFQKNINREEFIEILMKVYLDEKRRSILSFRSTNYFNDTDNLYIEYAHALGIVNGVGNNNFAPSARVTRQEMAVMMKNVLEALDLVKGNFSQSNFNDRKEMASWALDAIDYCSSEGIINGMGDGSFAPLANATREQAFKLVDNIYKAFALKDDFNRKTPNKIMGDFLTYYNQETNLEVYMKDNALVILSKGIVDFGEELNIKEDHYQIYRILESNDAIGFDTINQILSDLDAIYDPVGQKYLNYSISYDLKTGKESLNLNESKIQIESDNQLKITVKLY